MIELYFQFKRKPPKMPELQEIEVEEFVPLATKKKKSNDAQHQVFAQIVRQRHLSKGMSILDVSSTESKNNHLSPA